MNGPGVYVICLHPLVCDALLSLLRQAGIQVVGRSSDPSLGLAEIQRLQPQAILMEGATMSSDFQNALWAYVGQADGRRLLVLDPDRNVLSTYTHQNQVIHGSGDLVQALGALEENISVLS